MAIITRMNDKIEMNSVGGLMLELIVSTFVTSFIVMFFVATWGTPISALIIFVGIPMFFGIMAFIVSPILQLTVAFLQAVVGEIKDL